MRPPTDGVALALKQLERQNAGIIRLAHTLAGVLVIVTSVAALIALAGDTLAAAIAGRIGLGIPLIDAGISLALVVAMDTGMLVAAASIRVKATRRGSLGTMAGDVAILAIVAALEAGTYAYLLLHFEAPANGAAGALIVARALTAPVLAIYLSMARPVAVTTADVLALAEIAAGGGVLRDVTALAGDATAPLARKVRLYVAAARPQPEQRAALEQLIAAVGDTPTETAVKEDGGASHIAPAPPIPDPAPPTAPEPPAPAGHVRTATAARPQTQTRGGRLRVVRAMLDTDPEASVSAIMQRLKVARSTAHSLQQAVLGERVIMLAPDRPRRRVAQG